MDDRQVLTQLSAGAVLESPPWTEPVKVLTAKARGSQIELQEIGLYALVAEPHRIRLAYQYDPHFAVSVSQINPLPHQMDAAPKVFMVRGDHA